MDTEYTVATEEELAYEATIATLQTPRPRCLGLTFLTDTSQPIASPAPPPRRRRNEPHQAIQAPNPALPPTDLQPQVDAAHRTRPGEMPPLLVTVLEQAKERSMTTYKLTDYNGPHPRVVGQFGWQGPARRRPGQARRAQGWEGTGRKDDAGGADPRMGQARVLEYNKRRRALGHLRPLRRSCRNP